MIYQILLLNLFKSNVFFSRLHSLMRLNCTWNVLNIPVYLFEKVIKPGCLCKTKTRMGVFNYGAITSAMQKK